MSDCKKCFHACVCKKRPMIDGATIVNCRFFITDEPQTNADRIRAMSDEELAHELALVASWNRSEFAKAKKNGLETFMMNWLQQPAKEGE